MGPVFLFIWVHSTQRHLVCLSTVSQTINYLHLSDKVIISDIQTTFLKQDGAPWMDSMLSSDYGGLFPLSLYCILGHCSPFMHIIIHPEFTQMSPYPCSNTNFIYNYLSRTEPFEDAHFILSHDTDQLLGANLLWNIPVRCFQSVPVFCCPCHNLWKTRCLTS